MLLSRANFDADAWRFASSAAASGERDCSPYALRSPAASDERMFKCLRELREETKPIATGC